MLVTSLAVSDEGLGAWDLCYLRQLVRGPAALYIIRAARPGAADLHISVAMQLCVAA